MTKMLLFTRYSFPLPVVSALVASLLLQCHQTQSYSLSALPKINLGGDGSYMLDMFVHKGKNVYKIQEMHSAWQQRTKFYFEYYHNEEGRKITTETLIFIDKDRRVLEVELFDKLSCIETDLESVDGLFNRNIIPFIGTAFYGEDTSRIGAGRLLSFVQANSDKFNQVNQVTAFKNQLYNLFRAKFKPVETDDDDELIVTLYYHADAGRNLLNGIPHMISLRTNQGGTITYKFNQYLTLKAGQVQADPTSSAETLDQYHYSDSGDEVTFDMFAVEPSLSCSNALDVVERLEPKFPDSARFSFTARASMADRSEKEPEEFRVVYEPYLDNLRVEQKYKSKSVIKLMDFRDNRQYNIVRKHSFATDPVLDTILSLKPGEVNSCVVSKINAFALRGNPYTMKQMLFGTDNLAYMGLARVRGIEARVYEYNHCDWPLWLQQPSIYLDASDETHRNETAPRAAFLRDDMDFMKRRRITMSNVFYFAKTGSDEYDITQAKLLLVEVLFKNDKTGDTIKKHSYSIFDFELWFLPSSSPTGGRYEDSFSLQNDCLANVDNQEQYGTIDLLLEAQVERANLAWLQDRTKRNLAILQLLQERVPLEPISMVYDIESRLTLKVEDKMMPVTTTIIRGNQEDLYHPVSLAITMKTARRNDRVAQLVYHGLKDINSDYVNIVKLGNFHLCHMLAAHQRIDTIFAYRSQTFECCLIKPELSSTFKGDLDKLLKKMIMNAAQNPIKMAVELYQIQHDETRHDIIDRLHDAENLFKRNEHLYLMDPTGGDTGVIDMDDTTSSDISKIKVDVKSAHVARLDDEKMSHDEGKNGQVGGSGANKFLGVGLVMAEDQNNKLVELKGSADDHQLNESMSFEHCQTACLADPECRSFSVCYRRGVMSCVVSGASFDTPSIARQIMLITEKKKAKLGERFLITIDPEEQPISKSENVSSKTVQLMKHPACELHNKLYRDLFKYSGRFPHKLTRGSVVYPVASVERCSEICFLITLDFLKVKRSELPELQARLFSTKSLDHESTTDNICDSFYYIDQEAINLLEPERATRFKKSLEPSSKELDGYCVLDRNVKTTGGQSSAVDELGGIFSKRYEFNYFNLYTKQAGVSMVATPLSEHTTEVLFGSFKRGGDPKNHLAEIKPNENYGTESYHSSGIDNESLNCAKSCFWPSHGGKAYPACLSFDRFVITNPRESTRRVCGFNSMTLAAATAANRSDLIRIGSDKQERVRVGPMDTVRVWHYELRSGLVADSVEAMYKIQLAQDIKLTEDEQQNSTQVHIGAFQLFCCLVVLLSLGIALGIALGPRIRVIKSQILHEDAPVS